jgi:hypothetical protein
MAEQRKAIITSEPVRGACFGEDLNEHISVFVPLREVVDSRFLHIDDYITFDLVENLKRPGKFMAANVRYDGHRVARQIGEARDRSERRAVSTVRPGEAWSSDSAEARRGPRPAVRR